MEKASLVVDMRHIRCGDCKVAVDDELARKCPACGATFSHVASNHVGLAEKLRRKRFAAGLVEQQDHELPDEELTFA